MSAEPTKPNGNEIHNKLEPTELTEASPLEEPHDGEKQQRRPRDTWTQAEHNLFFEKLAQVGRDFDQLEAGIDTKDREQVRGFYYRCLQRAKQYLNEGDWTGDTEEDLKLVSAYGELRRVFSSADPTAELDAKAKPDDKLHSSFQGYLKELYQQGFTDVALQNGSVVRVVCPVSEDTNAPTNSGMISASDPAFMLDHESGQAFWSASLERTDIVDFVVQHKEGFILQLFEHLRRHEPSPTVLDSLFSLAQYYSTSKRNGNSSFESHSIKRRKVASPDLLNVGPMTPLNIAATPETQRMQQQQQQGQQQVLQTMQHISNISPSVPPLPPQRAQHQPLQSQVFGQPSLHQQASSHISDLHHVTQANTSFMSPHNPISAQSGQIIQTITTVPNQSGSQGSTPVSTPGAPSVSPASVTLSNPGPDDMPVECSLVPYNQFSSSTVLQIGAQAHLLLKLRLDKTFQNVRNFLCAFWQSGLKQSLPPPSRLRLHPTTADVPKFPEAPNGWGDENSGSITVAHFKDRVGAAQLCLAYEFLPAQSMPSSIQVLQNPQPVLQVTQAQAVQIASLVHQQQQHHQHQQQQQQQQLSQSSLAHPQSLMMQTPQEHLEQKPLSFSNQVSNLGVQSQLAHAAPLSNPLPQQTLMSQSNKLPESVLPSMTIPNRLPGSQTQQQLLTQPLQSISQPLPAMSQSLPVLDERGLGLQQLASQSSSSSI